MIAREETAVRPDRPGLKVAEILAEPGDNVTPGQALARLTQPEGGVTQVQSPVAGLILASSAVIGAIASAKGEALFSIIARGEFDLVGMVPVQDYRQAFGQSERADQGDRRRRGGGQGAPGSADGRTQHASSVRC